MTKINKILVQFSFTNANPIPHRLIGERTEKLFFASEAKNGKEVLEATEQVSLDEMLKELKGQGYAVVDGFWGAREREGGRGSFFVVRFILVKGGVESAKADQALAQMIQEAFWRVRAFRNPLEDQTEGLSINLTARVPRKTGGGEPIKVWLKDANGARIGDAPVVLQPRGVLSFDAAGTPCITTTQVEEGVAA